MSEMDCPETHEKAADEVRNVSVDFRGKLDGGELLTGTPTVTVTAFPSGDAGDDEPEFDNEVVSSDELTINGETVAAGEAVQFTVEGGVAGSRYWMVVQVDTDAGQTLVARQRLNVT